MKPFVIAAAMFAAATAAAPAMAANVGVSISVGQPGFYGRINIGDFPRPEVVYTQPVLIRPGPVTYPRQPIYLRVPAGYEQNWGRYCSRYDACGQPVYFVRDSWYRDVYAPRYYQPRPAPRPVVVVRNPPPRTVVVRPVIRHDDHRRDDRGPGRYGHGNGRGDGPGNGRGDGPGNGNGRGPN